jgi:hypothetical protein
MTIDNVPQAKWLATAPPDDRVLSRLTKLGEWLTNDDDDESKPFVMHLYFDTATDLMYQCRITRFATEWFCTDPNRKGVFA